ncbi:MAG: cytochrome oxidase assembly protein [Steroidobacteraceae bacterium]
MSPNPGNRRTLYLLAAIFFVPLIVSFAMYYGGTWRPVGKTNHGELVDPARPLPALPLPQFGSDAPIDALRGKWSLVYIGAGSCDASCRQALLVMRQTRLSLNNEMDRVERVLLATSECCDKQFLDTQHRGLIAVDASGAAALPLIALFPQDARDEQVFVVDPRGNLVMRYDTRAAPKGLLEDLKKLLKLSHIG